MKAQSKGNRMLFDLVKSLSRSEKRYFKLYNSRHALAQNGVNEKLFVAIDKQKDFNERHLLVLFQGQAFTNNFSVAKNRLYSAILKSLHFFHSDKSDLNKLYSFLNEIEILYDKGLYESCKKLISKTKALANANDRHAISIILSEWEIKLLERKQYENASSDSVSFKLEEYGHHLGCIVSYARIQKLKNVLFKNLYQGKLASKEVSSFVKNEIEYFDSADDLDKRSKLILYKIKSGWSFAQNNMTRALKYSEMHLGLIQKKDYTDQISTLGNIIYLAIQLKQFDKAKTHLFHLKEIEKKCQDMRLQKLKPSLFENISALELLLKYSENNLDHALSLIPPIAERLSYYNGQIGSLKRASFYLNFAQLNVIKNNLKEALKWTNTLLNYPKSDKNEGVFSHALLLNLLVHSELGNHDLVINKMRSAERYLKIHCRLGAFEKLFLANIGKRSKNEITFEEWRSDLNGLSQTSIKDSLLEIFDLNVWLDSKSKGVTMAEIMEAI